MRKSIKYAQMEGWTARRTDRRCPFLCCLSQLKIIILLLEGKNEGTHRVQRVTKYTVMTGFTYINRLFRNLICKMKHGLRVSFARYNLILNKIKGAANKTRVRRRVTDLHYLTTRRTFCRTHKIAWFGLVVLPCESRRDRVNRISTGLLVSTYLRWMTCPPRS